MDNLEMLRIAAFSVGERGGNPAGVAFVDHVDDTSFMRAKAAEIGYSETAFAARHEDGWRVRYFAPETEVPFCGHATIALGAALGRRFGPKTFKLALNDGEITVEAIEGANGRWGAALQSPPTWSRPLSKSALSELLDQFALTDDDLDPRLPPRLASAGATHAILGLASQKTLSRMRYDLALMAKHGLTTVMLVWAETHARFHARNPFAIGGVYEDPATGAAAAAFGGMLRDIGWSFSDCDSDEGGAIEIVQGVDMGAPSHLSVSISPVPLEGIRVSGLTRDIGA